MSRSLGTPSSAAPYLATFEVTSIPDLDIDSTGDAAPVRIPWELVQNGTVSFICGADEDGLNPEWHLLAYDPTLEAVVGVLPGVSASPNTGRRQTADNVSGVFLHVPLEFQVSAMQLASRYEYYLVPANDGGSTGTLLYLVAKV